MKCLFFLLSATWALSGFCQTTGSKAFTLSGKVTNLQQGWVYLRYPDASGKNVYDSAALQNGNFSFNGTVPGPVMASLSGKMVSRSMEDPNFTSFFLEPGQLRVEVADQAFKDARVTGSPAQKEYESLWSQQMELRKRWKVVMDTLTAVNKRSNVEYQELKAWVLAPYFAEANEMQARFIRSHPASYVTAYLLQYDRELPTDSLRKIYAAFPQKVQQSVYGKNISTELEKRKIGVPGAVAAAFTTTDINGQALSLADFKGKWVLIDFWASWCVPCRKGNPHLKELYAQYKDKGFEVIGVSDDDRDHAAWKQAVEKDGLPWKHVLRGVKMTRNGEQVNVDRSNDILDYYNVSSLPTQILVDPAGKIIGRYSEGSEEQASLDKQLQTIFK
ncbi:MAG: AhpC/TSA family protein [Williamsia sp.]|nr:AhpC/TSA family protein [Williamsia sp.]